MSDYDISMHGIRVVLDAAYYCEPARRAPLDIEGTALAVVDVSIIGLSMIKEGRFIELLCDPYYADSVDVFIRWDNDEKEWFTGGSLLLRRAKISFCSSIWTGRKGVQLDTRDFHELKPRYYTHRSPYSFISKTTWATIDTIKAKYTPEDDEVTYNDILQIPPDGDWHKAYYQGHPARAKRVAEGYAVQELLPGAKIQILPYEPPPPPPPMQYQLNKAPQVVESQPIGTVELHDIGNPHPTFINTTPPADVPPDNHYPAKYEVHVSNTIIRDLEVNGFADDIKVGTPIDNTTMEWHEAAEAIDDPEDEIDDDF